MVYFRKDQGMLAFTLQSQSSGRSVNATMLLTLLFLLQFYFFGFVCLLSSLKSSHTLWDCLRSSLIKLRTDFQKSIWNISHLASRSCWSRSFSQIIYCSIKIYCSDIFLLLKIDFLYNIFGLQFLLSYLLQVNLFLPSCLYLHTLCLSLENKQKRIIRII